MFPHALRPVICWAPGPLSNRPSGRTACQLSPSCDHQTTTSWSPPSPSVPVATKPPPAATRAVTPAGLPSTGSVVSRQVLPPLTETAANGAGPNGRACTPRAAIRLPRMATRWSTALRAPAASASDRDCHPWPSRESQTAGCVPTAPTPAKPLAPAATASSADGTPLRADPVHHPCGTQVVRSADHHSAAIGWPCTSRTPATTYPRRPAAAPARATPGPASVPALAAGPQVCPSGEVRTTGCWLPWGAAESRVPAAPTWAAIPAGPPSPPTASQPAPPWTTPVSPGPWPRQDGGAPADTGDHRPPGARDQIAGAP